MERRQVFLDATIKASADKALDGVHSIFCSPQPDVWLSDLTRRSPFLLKPTTEGSNRDPSAAGMTIGSPPSMTATTLFVVPKSILIIFPMDFSFFILTRQSLL